MFGWMLFGCLDVWLVDWLIGWMFGCLVGCLVGCLDGCLDVWLVDSVMFAISLARPSPAGSFYPKPEIYVGRCLCPKCDK